MEIKNIMIGEYNNFTCAGGGNAEERGAMRGEGRSREEWTVSGGALESQVRGGGGGGVPVASTWDLLLPIWDMEDRPEIMQNRAAVDGMSLENAFAYKQHYEAQAKREGKGEAIFGKDKKLPTKKFEEGEDNCGEILHKVRFERGPVVETEKYWADMPLRRKETYRHLALEGDGAEGLVNESVITRAHDRSLPLRIRMFAKGNLSKKGFGGVDNKEPASDWEAPKGVLALQEALLNFGDVYNKLWPLDNTPRRLERVLVHYRYGEKLGGTEREWCKIMEDFCDKILRENSCRAVREKAPLTVRQAKERWRESTEVCDWMGGQSGEKKSSKLEKKMAARDERKAGGNDGGKAAGGTISGGSRSDGARFNGGLVCFHYNNKNNTCTRPVKGDGCDNGRGGVFAHVCNFESAGGRYCLQKHKRHENH